jgi:Pyruvate/2-oxoacid:ferredoxin oxidoreductase delta subunit
MRWLQTVRSAAGHRAVVERIELDADGKPHPTGELTELDADCVVLALGQDADLGLVEGLAGVTVRDGAVLVDADHMTGRPGVFAGGDAIAAERTAATAVGHGRRAAAAIDAWLSGEARTPPAVTEPAVLDGMNTWYFEEAPHVVRGRLERARRSSSFDEVVHGLTAPDALFEARRCLSCGQCFACDNCFGVCPDAAVIKLEDGGGYAIDLEHCKGCGLCVAECPSGAMRMIEEPA